MLDGSVGMGSVGRGLNTLDRARSAWAAREVVLARVVMVGKKIDADRWIDLCVGARAGVSGVRERECWMRAKRA